MEFPSKSLNFNFVSVDNCCYTVNERFTLLFRFGSWPGALSFLRNLSNRLALINDSIRLGNDHRIDLPEVVIVRWNWLHKLGYYVVVPCLYNKGAWLMLLCDWRYAWSICKRYFSNGWCSLLHKPFTAYDIGIQASYEWQIGIRLVNAMWWRHANVNKNCVYVKYEM